MNDEITICIGTDGTTEIARKVLEYSILQSHKGHRRISFVPLSDPPCYRELGTATGFSLQRWRVPEIRGYDGWAIYLDADQLVFSDIADLWDIATQPRRTDTSAWCTYYHGRPETSVMLIDCACAKYSWPTLEATVDHLRSLDRDGRSTYYSFVMSGGHLRRLPAQIPSYWNHLNQYEPGVTRLLHFTGQMTQPWRYPEHPLAKLWKAALLEALKVGRVHPDDVRAACNQPAAWECMHRYWLSVL